MFEPVNGLASKSEVIGRGRVPEPQDGGGAAQGDERPRERTDEPADKGGQSAWRQERYRPR